MGASTFLSQVTRPPENDFPPAPLCIYNTYWDLLEDPQGPFQEGPDCRNWSRVFGALQQSSHFWGLEAVENYWDGLIFLGETEKSRVLAPELQLPPDLRAQVPQDHKQQILEQLAILEGSLENSPDFAPGGLVEMSFLFLLGRCHHRQAAKNLAYNVNLATHAESFDVALYGAERLIRLGALAGGDITQGTGSSAINSLSNALGLGWDEERIETLFRSAEESCELHPRLVLPKHHRLIQARFRSVRNQFYIMAKQAEAKAQQLPGSDDFSAGLT